MFERYTISTAPKQLGSELGTDVTDHYKPVYNAAPTGLLPVITDQHPQGFSFFYWGLPPEMSKKKSVSRKLLVAPLGELEQRASYREALYTHRCLVVADGLYFWKQISKKAKVPYRFVLSGQKPFLLAGLWSDFDADSTDMEHTFTLICREATESMKSFTDQVPVVVLPKDKDRWLSHSDATSRKLSDILHEEQPEFGFYPVSSRINKLDLNSPDLITQTKPVDQFGNYSLFD